MYFIETGYYIKSLYFIIFLLFVLRLHITKKSDKNAILKERFEDCIKKLLKSDFLSTGGIKSEEKGLNFVFITKFFSDQYI